MIAGIRRMTCSRKRTFYCGAARHLLRALFSRPDDIEDRLYRKHFDIDMISKRHNWGTVREGSIPFSFNDAVEPDQPLPTQLSKIEKVKQNAPSGDLNSQTRNYAAKALPSSDRAEYEKAKRKQYKIDEFKTRLLSDMNYLVSLDTSRMSKSPLLTAHF